MTLSSSLTRTSLWSMCAFPGPTRHDTSTLSYCWQRKCRSWDYLSVPMPPTSPCLALFQPRTCLPPTRNHPHKRSHHWQEKRVWEGKKGEEGGRGEGEGGGGWGRGDEEAKEEGIGKRSSMRETRKPRLSLVSRSSTWKKGKWMLRHDDQCMEMNK